MKITQLGVSLLLGMLFLQLMMCGSVSACDVGTNCDEPAATTKTINISRSNIKNNLTINPVIGPSRAVKQRGVSGSLTTTSNDPTTIGNSPINIEANLTSSDTTTTSNSPTVKNGILGDGVNVLSNTRLSAEISGNAVVAGPLGAAATPVAGSGNSIAGDAFAGGNGVTMTNMSSGNNSNVQSTMTINVMPTAR